MTRRGRLGDEKPNDGLLSSADAARILGLSADMVRLLARSGRLRTAVQSVRGVRLFRRTDVDALAAERAGGRACDHVVQFYDDDELLCDAIATFVRDGLRAGAPVAVVATESHREEVCVRLAREGIAIKDVVAREQLMLLDARETLACLMVHGMPDTERFQRYVGALIERRVASARARLRAFGEMVDLLCKDGNTDAACSLESLWNGLADAHSFSLLCAYAMSSFASGDQSRMFEQVCELHTRVLPIEGYAEGGDPHLRDRRIALLEQRASALQGEIELRKKAEGELRALKAELWRKTHGPEGTSA